MKFRFLYSIMLLLLASPAFSATTIYNYDELDRLHEVTLENGQKITYEYDEIGNIKSKTPSGNVVTISASATGSGKIYPNGNTIITAGGSKTYSITPLSGNQITNVYVDGVARGAITSYTFSNLAANHSIAANFGISDTTPPITSATPVGGTYSSAQTVTLSANESATIYYTTNGTTPTTSSAVYSAPLTISATTTLKYFAKDLAGNGEAVKTQTYTIQSGGANYTESFATTNIPTGWSVQGTASIDNMYHSAAYSLLLGNGFDTDGSVSFIASATGSLSFWYYKEGVWGYYENDAEWSQYGTNVGTMTVSVNGAVVYTVTADSGWVKTPLFSVHTGDTIKITQSGNSDDGGAYCNDHGGSCNIGDDRYDNILVYIDDVSIL